MLRIRQLREERGWSQRELAFKINANPKTVNFWERGVSEPSAGFVIALADVFECTADYVLGREDDLGSVNVQRQLTGVEQNLLTAFNRLAPKDAETLCAFAEFLSAR